MARRLLGLDLGIASAHTAVVLDADAAVVCRRRAIPTVDSLTVLEGPRWLARRLTRAWRW
jgi:hypothetical protein